MARGIIEHSGRWILGVILITAGIIFFFVPFVPGVVFVLLGLVVIYGTVVAKRMLRKWRRKGELLVKEL